MALALICYVFIAAVIMALMKEAEFGPVAIIFFGTTWLYWFAMFLSLLLAGVVVAYSEGDL